ncbi:MAG: hypothetical protein K0S33_1673 [Bacteroidetes bacterium]|jgi:ankyrin repeat protein|nr:hypothetical protein [Bacteroidota bacterium]
MKLFSVFCIFSLCVVAFSCEPTEAEKREAKIVEWKKMPPDKRNEELCKLMRTSPRYLPSDKIRALIEAGADANCSCTITHSSYDIVDFILRKPGSSWSVQLTPVQLSFEADSIALLDFMVKHGGKLDSIDIARSKNIRMWTYLFGKGFTKKDFTFLRTDAVKDTAHIQFLLDHGFGVNEPLDSNGTTLLTIYLYEKKDNDTSLLDLLVKNGADLGYGPKRSSHIGHLKPIIFHATGCRQKDLFFFMLRHGVKFRGYYYDNLTVLQDLIIHSKADTCYEQVKLLVDSGLSVNEQYDTELSALAYAIKGDNPKIMNLLLDKGAEWKQYTTWSGFRHDEPDPLEVCLDACATECLKILLERSPKKVNRKKLIKQLEYDIKEHPQFAGSDPKCKECLEILKTKEQ